MIRRPFVVTGIVWHEVKDKIAFENINLMEDVLNEHLQLPDYGSGLVAIAFIFIAVQPSNTIHEEEMTYRRKKKELSIQMKLPYELVEQYDRPQVLQLMAATYLHTIKDLSKLKIPDFDYQRFAKDVERLFEGRGWLVKETA